MRWLVAILGMIGLAGGVYLGLRPRLERPVLRVALNLRTSNADDDALAAGMALALEERDERAGRFRVRTAHQILQANGPLQIPRPGAHTMMRGLESRPSFSADDLQAALVRVDADSEKEAILAWMRTQNLARMEVVAAGTFVPRSIGKKLFTPEERERRRMEPMSTWLLTARPEVVFIPFRWANYLPTSFQDLRKAGFAGPIFLDGRSMSSLPSLEGCHVVLAPLVPAPPDFLRRHPHPFAYVGYRGTLRYLDAMDTYPKMDPMDLARDVAAGSAFDEHLGEPRVYQIQGGRLIPPK